MEVTEAVLKSLNRTKTDPFGNSRIMKVFMDFVIQTDPRLKELFDTWQAISKR